MFRVARQSMPLLIGCGSAAGISAIFNSPLGGVLFTLEVILQDFSMRTFTPVVLASVVANVTTQAIYRHVAHGATYQAIFALPMPWLEPVDISNAVLFLASDEARYITGVTLPVDGGVLIK